MSQVAVEAPPKGGFSFDLCRRNGMLSKNGVPPPSYRKTGTTIVGLIFQYSSIMLVRSVSDLCCGFELNLMRMLYAHMR
uniref:Uncharacterized protein n=1 Tax=Quercus lobata TaxID=97700 RepID=A0A7N2R1Q2_QUELO